MFVYMSFLLSTQDIKERREVYFQNGLIALISHAERKQCQTERFNAQCY